MVNFELNIPILKPAIVMKFGGSALGVNGVFISNVIERLNQTSQKSKIITVFSAPLTRYRDKVVSMTDVAIHVGKNYATSNPVEIDILREPFEKIAKQYLTPNSYNVFINELDTFHNNVIISLKQVAENRRFVDVSRSRILAYSGEIPMSYLMDYIMKENGIHSNHVSIQNWPIITDDNFEAANFLYEESKKTSDHILELVSKNDIVSMGGFIGKTIDGLETTYERGGSDRSAADIAMLLNDHYDVELDFEKDNVVLSADPKIVKIDLEYIQYLSYNEAKLAGMFGMKILDPIAIKDIDDNNLDIPMVITEMKNPDNVTRILKKPVTELSSLVKIVTGKKNCAIVRMESISASHLLASLERDKQYHDFIKLSPYKKEGIEITRILFLDGDYVRRQERHFKAYHQKVEIVYGRGVVTLIGDEMWKMPKIASTASSTVGEHGINILNLDAQEETSRILIVVDESNIADAVRAIHSKRHIIHGEKTS